MFIRSQNKEILLNGDVFAIEEKRYCAKINGRYTINVDDELNIYTDWKILANHLTVGIYSTKEKALKVLDEITSWINDLEYARNTKSYRNTFVYQMPQDDEVEE